MAVCSAAAAPKETSSPCQGTCHACTSPKLTASNSPLTWFNGCRQDAAGAVRPEFLPLAPTPGATRLESREPQCLLSPDRLQYLGTRSSISIHRRSGRKSRPSYFVLADWGIYPVRELASPPANGLPVEESPPTHRRARRFTNGPDAPATPERVHEVARRFGSDGANDHSAGVKKDVSGQGMHVSITSKLMGAKDYTLSEPELPSPEGTDLSSPS